MLKSLFLTFFKIGLFTFGGGYAMIAQMRETVVRQKAWLTEEELLEVITLNQLGYISAPVIMLNTNGYYDRLIAHFDHCVAEGFALPGARDIYALAETPEQALELALNMAPAALPDKLAYALEGKKEDRHGG